MQFIPTKTHAILDYVVGIFLMLSPWILDFAREGAETWAPVILGASTIGYSLLSKYEFGAARIISMPLHLALDSISGIMLAASPWLFNFEDFVYMPHVFIGIGEILVAAFTDPYYPGSHNRKGARANFIFEF